MTEATMIHAISSESLQTLLQSMGYRVTVSEHEGNPQLLSASQGIGFAVRPGNPAQTEGEFIDYTFSCVLRVQGEIPEAMPNNWNTYKRFARFSVQSPFLVLEMDVVVAGGVSENYLRATTEVWDRLLQELILFLREFSAPAPAAENVEEPVVAPDALSSSELAQ